MKIEISNYLIDQWIPELGEAELKVLFIIMRKTFGYLTTKECINIEQIKKFTDLDEQTVINASKSLKFKGLIDELDTKGFYFLDKLEVEE